MIRQLFGLVVVLQGFTIALCSIEGVEVNDEFVCPGPGIWPNPNNCQCFFNCANDVAFPFCCADGELFDIEFHDCNYASLVDCGDRPIPATTTAEPTTTDPDATTTPPLPSPFPKKALGMYILLADDFNEGFETDADWEPSLFPYQQTGSNLLFFTFINPKSMEVPKAFKKLSATRGTDAKGAVPADTLIIYAIGGYAYSLDPNPWDWLTSKEKAEDMAVQVAKWKDDYGVDGIDLDIEEGAGSNHLAGPNLIHFIRKIKSIHPDMIISQPTYGEPQVPAENDVINASWKKGGASKGVADSIGIMVYEGAQSLKYVENYADGPDMYGPIKVNVPKSRILVGVKGLAKTATIDKLAKESVKQDLLGIMAWYCSVVNGLKYEEDWDCTGDEGSEQGYVAAMELFKQQLTNWRKR